MKKRNKILRRYNLFRLILLLAFAVLVMSAKAQIEEDITVTAHGDAERKVIFTERLSALPSIVDTSFNAYPVKYSLVPINVEVNLIPKTISPVTITVLEPLEQMYRGYIKGGIGNFLMPYGDLYYNSTRNKSKQWGINLKHHSSQGGIKDIGFNGFSQNRAAVNYQRFYYKYSLGAKASFNRDAFYYYGYNPEVASFLSKDNTYQALNMAQTSLTYQTHYKDSLKINNRMNLDYRFMQDRYTAQEHYAKFTGEMTKLMDREVYGLDYSLDFNALSQPISVLTMHRVSITQFDLSDRIIGESQTNNAILDINPHIRTGGDNWKVRAGLSVQSQMENSAKFFFYPDIEADFSLFNDIFIPYVGVTGGLERNSFYTTTRNNPFILSNSLFKNTNNKYDVHGGIRGSISSKISFNVGAAVKKYNDFMLFVNDTTFTTEGNAFKPVYDTLTQTTFTAQVSYHQGEKLHINLRGEYFIYSTTGQEFAWNMPNYTTTLSAVYDLADKILVRGDVFLVGDRKTRFFNDLSLEQDGEVNVLKPFVDLNLGFEYRYTARLSAFINFNNILNQKYENWNFYQVQGFNVLGGVTYRF